MTPGASKNNSVRLAIVGLGNMGSAHATAVDSGKIDGLKLGAVCDIDESKRLWAKETLSAVAVYDDYSTMLQKGNFDAVLIAVPHDLHPSMAIAAMQLGYHVLTEKPAGIRVSDVISMNETARKTGVVFGIMLNQRTNPLYERARDIVHSGGVGAVKRIGWTITNWYRTDTYYRSGAWRASWAGEGGGVLLNQAPHNLDLWQWIYEMPISVFADCAVGKYHDIEVEDDCTIFARYANGASGTFITSTGENPGSNRLEIAGTDGKLVVEDGVLRFWKLSQNERDFCKTAEVDDGDIPSVYTEWKDAASQFEHIRILQNFTDSIQKGTPLLAPGTDGIYSLSLSNAAYLSSWEKREIALPFSKADRNAFDAALQKRIDSSRYHVHNQAQSSLGGSYQSRWLKHW